MLEVEEEEEKGEEGMKMRWRERERMMLYVKEWLMEGWGEGVKGWVGWCTEDVLN